MTTLRQMLLALKAEIALPKNRSRWEVAQKRHPVLRRVMDIQHVLKILGDLKRNDLRHKDILAKRQVDL